MATMPFAPHSSLVVERVCLHKVSRHLGFASVWLPGVHLRGLRVEERDGRLLVSPPETLERRNGRRWAVYALQPSLRELVEAAIAVQWGSS